MTHMLTITGVAVTTAAYVAIGAFLALEALYVIGA